MTPKPRTLPTEAPNVSTPNHRYALQNRKDLCNPDARARDLANLDDVQHKRALAPPTHAHRWERVRRRRRD
jgi:hypothetical protein